MEESVFVPVSNTVHLEARIYDPSSSLQGSPVPSGLAIIAHPYGSLGGCFDDHVVCALAETLLVKRRMQVLTFNSRGVGRSTGRASWTGSAECDDFQAVLEWAVAQFESKHPSVRGAALVLCGYSAGSLYCSTVKVSPAILARPTWADAGSGPLYVLVSYPRGVLWALSLFQAGRYERGLQDLAGFAQEPAGRSKSPRILLIQGGRDSFTSSKTYEEWTSAFTTSDRVDIEHVEEADHFWRTRTTLQRLTDSVCTWISSARSQH